MTIKPLFALSIFPAENPTNILTAELSKLSLQEPKALEQPKLHLRGGRRKKKRDRNLPPWIVIEFDRYFGDASKLENWQRLCKDLSVDPIPVSVTQCRKVYLLPYFSSTFFAICRVRLQVTKALY